MGVDRGNPTPLYYQLELELLAKIREGEWGPGEPIPTETEICAAYGVSRTTVRQAMANLVRQGVVVRRAGKGSFVRKRRVVANMQRGLLQRGLEAAGMEPHRRVLRFEVATADPYVVEELGVHMDTPILWVRRLLLGDTTPIAYADIYIPRQLGPNLTREDFEALNTYQALSSTVLGLAWGWVTLESRLVTADEVDILEIPLGFPVLTTTRLTHMEDGRPFELLKWVGRADMVAFSTDFDSPYAYREGIVTLESGQAAGRSGDGTVRTRA